MLTYASAYLEYIFGMYRKNVDLRKRVPWTDRDHETRVAFVSLWPCFQMEELSFALVIIGNASVTITQWPSLVFDVANFNLHFDGFLTSSTGFSFPTISARENEMMSQRKTTYAGENV